MKTALSPFPDDSCAALMRGTGYAAPSAAPNNSPRVREHSSGISRCRAAAPADGGETQTAGKPSDEQRDHRHVSDKNHPRSRASLTKANRPQQLPNNRQRSTSGNAMNLHQPGSDKSGGAAKADSSRTKQPTTPCLFGRQVSSDPTVPSLNNVRHRGPNPAVIGGSANSDTRNTGAINGTQMNRKP